MDKSDPSGASCVSGIQYWELDGGNANGEGDSNHKPQFIFLSMETCWATAACRWALTSCPLARRGFGMTLFQTAAQFCQFQAEGLVLGGAEPDLYALDDVLVAVHLIAKFRNAASSWRARFCLHFARLMSTLERRLLLRNNGSRMKAICNRRSRTLHPLGSRDRAQS